MKISFDSSHPSRLPVIILHGWSINPENAVKWQSFRDTLQKKGVETEFLGLPGLSSPLQEVWGLGNYVDWLDGQIKKYPQVILLGHSFGGQIAARYSAKHPEKVAKLVLIDSSGIRDHSFLATTKRTGFLVAAKVGKVFFQSDFFRNILYKLAREKDYQQAPPLLRRTMSSILDEEVVADLAHISAPTLLIWGAEDTVTPLFLGKIFATKIRHNQFKTISGARHSPQFTHINEVAQAVADFVQYEN